MRERKLVSILALALVITVVAGCGILGKRDSLLKLCPYKKPAFYGRVVDKDTGERPLYPVAIAILPEDPGNHVVVDSSVFFIDDKGLEPIYDYSLRVGAQYYSSVELPLKYVKGKTQNLGVIELKNIEPVYQGPFKIKPFVEFSPGSGILEKPGWSISSFLSHWKTVDQPFTIDDVEQYVKESLPPGSPEISKDEIRQAVDGWLKDNLIISYGRNSYMLK